MESAAERLRLGGKSVEEFTERVPSGTSLVREWVDQFGVQPEALGAPEVLTDQHGVAIVLVGTGVDFIRQVGDQAVDQGGDGEGIVQRAGHVAHANFDGPEIVVRSDRPPDVAD